MSTFFDAMMRGDIDALVRAQKEREFKNMAAVTGAFRDSIAKSLRPMLVEWLEMGAVHYPSCGPETKGDLVRWVDVPGGGRLVRMPTIRRDLVSQAVAGKIHVNGVELLMFLSTKLDERTVRALMQRKKA